MHHLHVNDVDLAYIEQGTGVPVLFVHGAISDLRYWEPQRQAIAQSYRFIAYTYRYHGTSAWPDEGQQYSYDTHIADLEAFMRGLNIGPAHLVGFSGGGRVATLVAAQCPYLVRSLTLVEPALHELLVDLPDAQSIYDEWGKGFEASGRASETGDIVQATKLFLEHVNNQGTGAFDTQPQALRQMFLDNARTLPLSSSAPTPPPVSGAILGSIKVPILIFGGENTVRYFSLINQVVLSCIPGGRLVIIPQATHTLSYQNPVAFNEELLHFLSQH